MAWIERKMMLFRAIRSSFTHYTFASFASDIRAGVMVALVALPLSLALAVAVNVPPQNGLYTAIFAGMITALAGGSRYQVTGPTAAFVVVLLPIVHRFGIAGLLYAGFLAGIILIVFSLMRVGRVIRIIPFPVTTGFTLGIGVVLLTLQVKDLLGLQINFAHDYLSKVLQIFASLSSLNSHELTIGLSTLGLLGFLARYVKRTPAPVVGLLGSVLIVELIRYFSPNFHVTTIASRYSHMVDGSMVPGIPAGLPPFVSLWEQFTTWRQAWEFTVEILPSALTIAILGAIESLLSAVVADTMTHTRHDPDGELIAQGFGNIIAPFFGGIPACGAIARTATNIRFGAVSPLAAAVHSLTLGLCVLLLAPLLGKIPMAALAALLILVAFHMIDPRHIKTVMYSGSREDKIVFLCCFILTVLFDMTVGVTAGMLLAALLFVNRVANFTEGKWSTADESLNGTELNLPSYVQLYEIEGPLFFGAAERAISSLHQISNEVKAVIIDLQHVPMIDVTALTALESSLNILSSRRHLCVACKVAPAVAAKIKPFLRRQKLEAVLRIVGSRREALAEIEAWLTH